MQTDQGPGRHNYPQQAFHAKDDPIFVRYRNRDIRRADIERIKGMIQANPGKGRAHLSRMLCEIWDWRSPGGGLKEYACRDLLLRLEEWGHVTLPPRQRGYGKKRRAAQSGADAATRRDEIESCDLSRLLVRPVRDKVERLLWRTLVDRYHYLGEGVMTGSHLLYLAVLTDPDLGSERVVACLGWGSASLRNPKRDAFIGWDFEQMRKQLHSVANNQRFLILPWVKVKNLGSRILRLNFQRLSRDWKEKYGHEILCVETFVDVSRFPGTVYKAANWKYLGLTAGRSKRGNEIAHKKGGQVKAIFVYPSRLKAMPGVLRKR